MHFGSAWGYFGSGQGCFLSAGEYFRSAQEKFSGTKFRLESELFYEEISAAASWCSRTSFPAKYLFLAALNEAASRRFFPNPFIFQDLQSRQPPRLFFGLFRLWLAIGFIYSYSLFIMGPHSQYANDFFIFENFINQPMLDINSS